ncbi:hypothetical protein VTJ04DRAFT_8222 [Mycothermus thermophilus]|uniref:uncharacterized protein n=1 Tax=Humicola insolens TaxID=85995 RepID=UPI003743F98C
MLHARITRDHGGIGVLYFVFGFVTKEKDGGTIFALQTPLGWALSTSFVVNTQRGKYMATGPVVSSCWMCVGEQGGTALILSSSSAGVLLFLRSIQIQEGRRRGFIHPSTRSPHPPLPACSRLTSTSSSAIIGNQRPRDRPNHLASTTFFLLLFLSLIPIHSLPIPRLTFCLVA